MDRETALAWLGRFAKSIFVVRKLKPIKEWKEIDPHSPGCPRRFAPSRECTCVELNVPITEEPAHEELKRVRELLETTKPRQGEKGA
jgi:hypothetical protein